MLFAELCLSYILNSALFTSSYSPVFRLPVALFFHSSSSPSAWRGRVLLNRIQTHEFSLGSEHEQPRFGSYRAAMMLHSRPVCLGAPRPLWASVYSTLSPYVGAVCTLRINQKGSCIRRQSGIIYSVGGGQGVKPRSPILLSGQHLPAHISCCAFGACTISSYTS